MKYIDVNHLRAEIERLNSLVPYDNDRHDEGLHDAYKAVMNLIDSLQQEQPEMDLEKEIRRYLREECSADDEPSISDIARHFAEWGRKQVLQEIYDGKVKPVDKITAAWLDNEPKTEKK